MGSGLAGLTLDGKRYGIRVGWPRHLLAAWGTGKGQGLVFFLNTYFPLGLLSTFLCVSPLLDSVKLIIRGDRLASGKDLIRLEKQEQNILLTENHMGQVRTRFESTLLASVEAKKLFQNCRHLVNTD